MDEITVGVRLRAKLDEHVRPRRTCRIAAACSSRDECDPRIANRGAVKSCAALTTVCAILACTVLALGATDGNSAAAALTHGASSAQRRVVLLGLRQRGNPATFASQVSDPSSRWYRRFLSLRQYQSRFSPTRADRQRVQRYLALQPGVLKVQLSSDQSVVLVVVTVPAGQRLFCARGDGQPTRGLCTPRSLRGEVREISAGEVYQASGGARDAIPRRDGTSQTCAGAIKTRAFNPHQLSTAYGVDALRARGLDGSGLRVDTLSSQEVDASSFTDMGEVLRASHAGRAPVRDAGGDSRHVDGAGGDGA